MTLSPSSLRRILILTLLSALPALGLSHRAVAQASAAAAITHSANSGALTPGAVSAVLGAVTHDCSHQPITVDQAFQATASAVDANTVRVDWVIADKCYLYKSRIKVKAQGPMQLGALALPKGEPHSDEYFGSQEIYHHSLTATLPVTRTSSAGAQTVAIDVTYQGCAEIGLCYPPTTKTLTVSLPAVPGASGAVTPAGSVKFLDADQAFQVAATPAGADRIAIDWTIAEGYYLYRSRIHVKTDSPVQLGALALPEGENHSDEYFGAQQIYHHSIHAILPVARPGGAGTQDVVVAVNYQGCAHAGLCYPPITKMLSVSLPPTGAAGSTIPAAPTIAASAGAAGGFVSEQDQKANFIRNGNMLWVIASFFGSGLLLSMTPCVLPMVPILSGIIAGHGANVTTMRAFLLSLSYVLGMAFTYTLAGIAVAAAGSHVQAMFQQTWIIVLFSALFVVLAISMLGFFTIQMPAFIQTRLSAVSNRQTAGSFGGVVVMGALSALIVTTCVAPPLVGAFLAIGQSGNVVRGGIALFALSLGMGAPLLVVGASQGKLLPRAGAWMDTIKQLFGAMMLGVAAWMLARVTAPQFVLLLWAIPAAVTAVILWRGARNIRQMPQLVRAFAVAAGAYAIVLVVGSRLGSSDPLQPLPALAGHHEELAFQTIKSTGDLDRVVAQAQTHGQAVMLDFYADWCASCKEMEKYTFTDPAVQATLKNVVLLRANVTANDSDDQALMKRFGIVGPPTIAFYGSDGQERAPYRVVGFMKAPEFADLSRKAISGGAATS